MDSHTASAVSRLLSGGGGGGGNSESQQEDDATSFSFVHLGEGLAAVDTNDARFPGELDEEEAATFGSLGVVRNDQRHQFAHPTDRSTIGTTTASSSSSSNFFSSADSSAADQLLRNRILAATIGGLHELSRRHDADAASNATSKRAIVGSAASADVSHLVLDVRDLAGFRQMRHSELAAALCRWILRRIFRADWNRDCFLCDLPLGHSCLMCFYALHAAPDQEAARSYNAVVCGGSHASCGHVYHRHCWSRWETQLCPCCPKCGASGIRSVKETFIIEKRCG